MIPLPRLDRCVVMGVLNVTPDSFSDGGCFADPATAIFSCSSRLSLGVVPALHQFGRTDVALVSFGAFTMADSVQPAVTVVDHSARRIAQTAAEALLAHLPPHDPTHGPTGVIEVPARLIPRGTGEIAAPPTPQQMSRA